MLTLPKLYARIWTDGVDDAIAEEPASIVYILLAFLAFLFAGGLCGFHIYLISTNQTTYEVRRAQFWGERFSLYTVQATKAP